VPRSYWTEPKSLPLSYYRLRLFVFLVSRNELLRSLSESGRAFSFSGPLGIPPADS